MFGTLATKLACFVLKHTSLNLKNRVSLINAIQAKLALIPITDIIKVNGSSITVNGVLLDNEQVTRVREGARAALDNYTLQFLHNQLNYEAIKLGVHTVNTMETMFFSKSAIWLNEKNRELLKALAMYDQELS